jgi:hypothetical protein
MQAIKAQEISPASASSHSSTETHGLRYTEVIRRAGLRVALHLLRENLGQKWCIWRDAFRSFRGHIRTQSAIGRAWVQVGSPRHQGILNIRSLARKLYIEKTSATLPWVDCQDLQVFLNGFDAGESFAAYTHNECMDRKFATASWLTPEIEREINNTLDMLKRQWYKSQYESARHCDPSQSD